LSEWLRQSPERRIRCQRRQRARLLRKQQEPIRCRRIRRDDPAAQLSTGSGRRLNTGRSTRPGLILGFEAPAFVSVTWLEGWQLPSPATPRILFGPLRRGPGRSLAELADHSGTYPASSRDLQVVQLFRDRVAEQLEHGAPLVSVRAAKARLPRFKPSAARYPLIAHYWNRVALPLVA